MREYYGSANSSTERHSAYLIMRLVTLMNLGSHILLNVVTMLYRRSETVLAHSILAAIPDNSIRLFDKHFYNADLLLTLSLQGDNRHWLLPAWNNIASETEESYAPRYRLLKLKVSLPAKKGILHCQSSGTLER